MDPKIDDYPIMKLQQQAALTSQNLAAMKTAAADKNNSLRYFGARQVRQGATSFPVMKAGR